MAIEIERSSLDNSYESKMKKEKEHLAPIVKKENVVTKKESTFSKIKSAFVSEDSKDIGNYILYDMVIPAFKDGIMSIMARLLGSDGSGYYGGRRDRYDSRDHVSYSSYWRSPGKKKDNRRDEDLYDRGNKVDYRNIVLRYREDAEKIVRVLRDSIREYGSATVAALLDLVDETSSWTDNDYGWVDERDISIQRVRNGYRIDVPEARYLGD